MSKRIFNLRNVAMIACLAATTMFSGCDPEDEPNGNTPAEGAPAAVMNFTATAGNAQVVLTWNAPTDNGGSEITAYELTRDNWATKVTKTAAELTHTYTGLTNGTPYTFKIRAVNAKGAGAESTATATPTSGSNTGTWTVLENTAFSGAIYGIAYGADKFIAVGTNYNNYGREMAYSTDGINWTAIANTGFTAIDPASSKNIIKDITYGGGKFVAVGQNNQMAYSTDGINWTSVANTAFKPALNAANIDRTNILCITYGNGKFVAGGFCDKVGGGSEIAYSTDGINWTAANASAFGLWTSQYELNHYVTSITYGGGKFVAGGRHGKLGYSTDGINWTAAQSPFYITVSGNEVGVEVLGIAYGNGKFVAVGQNAIMAYSTDGVNWTTITNHNIVNTPSTDFVNVIFANGKFIATGSNGKMAQSTDGINWTNISWQYSGTATYAIADIAHGAGKFVGVGRKSGGISPLIIYYND